MRSLPVSAKVSTPTPEMAAAAEMTRPTKTGSLAAEPHSAEITGSLEVLRPHCPPHIHLTPLFQSPLVSAFTGAHPLFTRCCHCPCGPRW